MIKFLFFDNWTYEWMRGFRRTVHEAKKHSANPVIVPDRPWEGTAVSVYGTVTKDPTDGLFKAWYSAIPNLAKDDDRGCLCLATSRDGIRWRKPALDVFKFGGRKTNVVIPLTHKVHGPAVIVDPHDHRPARRYKLIMRPAYSKGILAYGSRDGVHWRKLRRDWVIPIAADCHLGCYQDARTRRYTAYLRPVFGDRRVAYCESEDFVHWTRPALCLEPDQHDSAQIQFYSMAVTQYGGYVLGMLNVFRTWESDLRWNKSSGTLDIELAYSRDGRLWHRSAPNQPIVRMNGKGTWDGMMTYPSSTLVPLGDEIRLYYTGCPFHHDDLGTDKVCVGMAAWRVDGFVSADAGPRSCSLLTRPFAVREPELYLNADSRGEVCVEIQSSDGAAVPGFELSRGVSIRGDSTEHRVRWHGSPDFGRVRCKPIRLRVVAKNASLYSIWFPNGDRKPRYDEFREIACVNPLKDLQEPEERTYP